MSIDTLLSRLEKVKRTGNGRWVACCPSHEDRKPSLSIRDDAGKVLLHCFGGCDVYSVVAAVGMELDQLFPPKPRDETKRSRVTLDPMDALRCIGRDAMEAAIIISSLREAGCVPESVSDRLSGLANRIDAARRACSVN
jgi:CHC2 zinc finger